MCVNPAYVEVFNDVVTSVVSKHSVGIRIRKMREVFKLLRGFFYGNYNILCDVLRNILRTVYCHTIRRYWYGVDALAPPSKVCVIGLDDAGKTALLYKMKSGETPTGLIPTIGFNVEEMDFGATTLQIWDLGGQEPLR